MDWGTNMISKISVDLKDNPYAIAIGHGILGDIPRFIRPLGLGKDAVVISHPLVERLHGFKLSAALKKAGLRDKAEEMAARVFKAGSYEEALGIMQEYVEFR